MDTALVVEVPAAQDVVGPWRARADPSAAWGVPAHVTVLFPFLDSGALDGAVLARVGDVIAAVPAFDVTFATTGRFGAPGDPRVLWLAPEPAAPFVALTRAVWTAFPAAPAYGGAFGTDPETSGVTPHLTVVAGPDSDVLEAADTAVRSGLPLTQAVTRVSLYAGTGTPGGWSRLRTLPLGSRA